MTYIKKVLVGMVAAGVLVGNLLVGVAGAQAQIQEEVHGGVFKITKLDLATGSLDIGYYDLDHLGNQARQFLVVYATDGRTVTRAMMEETGLNVPEWGTVVAQRDTSSVALGNSAGINFFAPTASWAPRLANDFRASNGRLYYAVEIADVSGEVHLWVGGVDYTECSVAESQACRPVSTKWGITRMTQDYEQWGGMYEVLPEVETAGIDYTGWKPEAVENGGGAGEQDGEAGQADEQGSGQVVNSVAEALVGAEASLGERLLGSTWAMASNITGALTGAADNEPLGDDWGDAGWMDDGYYGTLDVPALGGDEETSEKCYNCCMENGFWLMIAFIVAWVLAQVSKLVIEMVRHKGKFTAAEAFAWLVKDGGMPSGHTASLTAATVMAGLLFGFGSGLFALAVCVLLIVIHDAISVRYAVGKQGKALNTLLKRPLKVVEGHTVPEVAVGLALGTVVAVLLNFIIA